MSLFLYKEPNEAMMDFLSESLYRHMKPYLDECETVAQYQREFYSGADIWDEAKVFLKCIIGHPCPEYCVKQIYDNYSCGKSSISVYHKEALHKNSKLANNFDASHKINGRVFCTYVVQCTIVMILYQERNNKLSFKDIDTDIIIRALEPYIDKCSFPRIYKIWANLRDAICDDKTSISYDYDYIEDKPVERGQESTEKAEEKEDKEPNDRRNFGVRRDVLVRMVQLIFKNKIINLNPLNHAELAELLSIMSGFSSKAINNCLWKDIDLRGDIYDEEIERCESILQKLGIKTRMKKTKSVHKKDIQ